MSGRARGGRGRNPGRGRTQGRGRGRGNSGRGNFYTGTTVKHKGLCSALGMHVFDYGQKAVADQMRTTWEKIVHHVGTIYGSDISNELQNKKQVVVPKPSYTQAILDAHQEAVTRRNLQELRLASARALQRTALEQLVQDGDLDAPMNLALLENQIEEATYQASIDLPIRLEGEDKTEHENKWRSYRERQSRLEKQRGQAFSMILGQCQQVLLDKMKHDPEWIVASESYDPLILMKLIEKTILVQTEDQ